MLCSPWPSSPHHPPRYSLTATFKGRSISEGFLELYAARQWLQAIDHSGVKVGGDVDLVRAYRPSLEETSWRLPEDRQRIIGRFLRGDDWDAPKVEPKPTVAVSTQTKTQRAPRAEIPDGYVSITELVKGTDISPMMARGILRSSKFEKQPFGWAFSPKDVAAVKKLIGLRS
jgi:hypothetical protein